MTHSNFRRTVNASRGPRSYTAQQVIDAFWARTRRGPNDCIIWTGGKAGSASPYGSATILGRTTLAHRLSVWMETGIEPPRDMQVDHLCRVTLCVNPDHLEVVTPAENTYRSTGVTAANRLKDACLRGHEFTVENTRILPRGGRECRACNRERVKRDSDKRPRPPCPVCGEVRHPASMKRHIETVHGSES